MSQDRLELDSRRVGSLLRKYRVRSRRPLQEIVLRLRLPGQNGVSRLASLGWLLGDAGRPESPQYLRARLKSLEDGEVSETLSHTAIIPLAEAYSVSPLMLESSVVDSYEGSRLVQSLTGFQMHEFPGRNSTGYGGECTYSVPRRGLTGSAAEFVRLEFREDGFADPHEHPGEELAFVRHGRVEYEFPDSGARIGLEEGDFIHFYSEQPHFARRAKDLHKDAKSELLIVRLHQLDDSGTRARITDATEHVYSALRKRDARLSHSLKKEFTEIVDPAFRQAGPARSGRVDTSVRQNVPGLGRWLRHYAAASELSESILAERAAAEGLDLPSSFFTHLHRSTFSESDLRRISQPVAASESAGLLDETLLGELSRIYRVEPILLRGFLFKAVDDLVIVRQSEDLRFFTHDSCHDIPDGARYGLPKRTLANADESLIFIELQPGVASPWNQHPGEEFVYCLSGTAEVRFDDPPHCPLSPGEYAHFRSDDRHAVVNPGSETCRVFAIRFHG